MRRLSRRRVGLLGLIAGVGVIGAAALAARRLRVERRIQAHSERVAIVGTPSGATPFHLSDVEKLPPPVRRYFGTVLRDGQSHITQVRLAQTGQFRLGGADAAWLPLTARQTYRIVPPSFVWDAEISLAPFLPVRVFDAYLDGEGLLRANLLGAIPVARAGPDPQMNEAELQRYLSETPWFPTALLPVAGVSWEAVDDHSARASITDGDVAATGVFHFDETGRIERLTTTRYRQDTGTSAPWVGHYRTYRTRNGMDIPTEAEVGWETADGVVPYWRGAISEIEHQTA